MRCKERDDPRYAWENPGGGGDSANEGGTYARRLA